MLILKGRLWSEGLWRAEISALQLLGKGNTAELALASLDRQINELAPKLEYELGSLEDGSLVLRCDDAVGLAFLILQRRITWK